MAQPSRYICVDWGLSRLRASLCQFADGACLVQHSLNGPGIMTARQAIEETLFEVIEPWTRTHGAVPILLSGGVWSNIGWRNTPYLACPFELRDLSSHCTTFSARGRDIVIVPGLECTNSFGEADTMRSEELQILGWLQIEPRRLRGSHVVCLPGTNTKWALVEDGRILAFQSTVTGEMYALMRDHSTLLAQSDEPDGIVPSDADKAFALGVAACREAQGMLSHALYSTRSRLLKGDLDANAAASYLSGILIAADVMGALELLKPAPAYVSLVGASELCDLFAQVLRTFGVDSETTEGDQAATVGFSIVYQDLYHRHERSASA